MATALTPLADRIWEYAPLLGAVALSLFALAIMLSITLRRAISEPVQALAATARDVTRLRDYRRRVSSDSNDEVGQLARDFNAMLETVEERERALRHSEETARRQLIEIEAIYANAQVGLCVIDRELRYVAHQQADDGNERTRGGRPDRPHRRRGDAAACDRCSRPSAGRC